MRNTAVGFKNQISGWSVLHRFRREHNCQYRSAAQHRNHSQRIRIECQERRCKKSKSVAIGAALVIAAGLDFAALSSFRVFANRTAATCAHKKFSRNSFYPLPWNARCAPIHSGLDANEFMALERRRAHQTKTIPSMGAMDEWDATWSWPWDRPP